MRTLCAASALAVLSFSAPAQAQQLPGSSFKVGSWSGGAYKGDHPRFSHCAASASYAHGVNLLFMVNRDYQWAVAFLSEQFNLEPKTDITLALALDGSAPHQVDAYVINNKMFRINLAPRSALFEKFQRAHALTLHSKRGIHDFSLRDTSTMLPVLLKCVRNQLAPVPMQEASRPRGSAPGSPRRYPTPASQNTGKPQSQPRNHLMRRRANGQDSKDSPADVP